MTKKQPQGLVAGTVTSAAWEPGAIFVGHKKVGFFSSFLAKTFFFFSFHSSARFFLKSSLLLTPSFSEFLLNDHESAC